MSNSALHKLIHRQQLIFVGVAIVLSAGLIFLSLQIEAQNPMMAKMVTAIGGSVLDTCLGILFSTVTNASANVGLRHMLEESLRSQLHATDAELEPYRRVWHHYQLTQHNKELIWRYRVVDLSLPLPNKLIGQLSVPSPSTEQKHTYRIEGFVMPPRLLLVQKRVGGTENPVVQIFPRATEGFRNLHAGLVCLQSWDGNDLTAPALLSTEPLDLGIGNYPVGTLPKETYKRLYQMWNDHALRNGLIPCHIMPGSGA